MPILDDRLVEADETFTVTLRGASNATLAAAVATGTIIDDDALAVTVTAAPHTVEEGSPAGFAVTLTGAISSEVTLEWATADGTARAGADYEAVAGGTLTFRPDAAPTRRLAVKTLQDDLEEGTETFTVKLMQVVLPAGQQVGPATATGTITDDDALSVGVSADALAVVEGEAATFTLALSGASATAPVVVDYTVTGSARAGSDYTAPGGSLTLGLRCRDRKAHDPDARGRGAGGGGIDLRDARARAHRDPDGGGRPDRRAHQNCPTVAPQPFPSPRPYR